jgi:hypothetical protein
MISRGTNGIVDASGSYLPYADGVMAAPRTYP